MKENYIYPARVEHKDNCYSVEFLDFENLGGDGETQEEAVKRAQNNLGLILKKYEEDNKKIPSPAELPFLTETQEDNIVYIHVWMPYFRGVTKEVYVKKNVTVPEWLNILAKEKNVSYSEELVKGIKQVIEFEEKNR